MAPNPQKRRGTASADAPGVAFSEAVSDDNQQSLSQPGHQPYSEPGSQSSSEAVGRNMNATVTAKLQARVLLDCRYGRCNTLVELDAEGIAQSVAERCLDTDPAAIAYLLQSSCPPAC